MSFDTMVCLSLFFCGFYLYVNDLDNKTYSIRQRQQIKSWLSICCKIGVICILVIIGLSNV